MHESQVKLGRVQVQTDLSRLSGRDEALFGPVGDQTVGTVDLLDDDVPGGRVEKGKMRLDGISLDSQSKIKDRFLELRFGRGRPASRSSTP